MYISHIRIMGMFHVKQKGYINEEYEFIQPLPYGYRKINTAKKSCCAYIRRKKKGY